MSTCFGGNVFGGDVCSHDQVPNGFHLFDPLKNILRGQRFRADHEIKPFEL